MIDLSGVFIPAVTPFLPETGEVDLEAMQENLRAWSGHPVHGIVIAGTTGEAVLLDPEERLALVRAARDILPERILLTVGTGVESTRGTIRLTRAAADAGADAVLVQPPAYYKGAMTAEALREHYVAVADASPVPVIIYQAPLRMCTLDFPTGLLAELSQHEMLVGLKDSRGKLELMGEVLDQCREGFQLLVGSGAHFYPALEIGAVGGIVAIGNLAPGGCGALYEAFVGGRLAEAGRLQQGLGPVHNGIVGGIGVGGVKHGMDLLGMRGGDPRPPLRPLGEKKREEVQEILRTAGLLSVP